MAVDTRYPQHRVRRQARGLAVVAPPLPVYAPAMAPAFGSDEVEQWPNWLIPCLLVGVMATISAYHADALLAVLRSLI